MCLSEILFELICSFSEAVKMQANVTELVASYNERQRQMEHDGSNIQQRRVAMMYRMK